MSDNILVFGGSILQASIIERAKLLGFNTILIDPNKSAIAHNIADEFYQVPGDDFEKTLNIAKKFKVKGLITAASDHPLLMMSKIAKKLKLPFPEYKSVDLVLDKWKFKRILKEADVLHANGFIINNLNDINILLNKLCFPVIIKPVKGSGSKGVYKCQNNLDLLSFAEDAIYFSKNGKLLIEEYIEGDEISVEGIVYENKVEIIQITDKIVSHPPYNVELGHIQPSKFQYRREEIRTILQKIVDLTKLNNCPIHPELKINRHGIYIIELGPRLGGDYITSHLVPLSTGINMEEQVIKMATTSDSNTYSQKSLNRASMIKYLSFPIGKKIANFISEKELKAQFPSVQNFEISLHKGAELKEIKNSFDRYGYFILTGENATNIVRESDKIEKFIFNKVF